MGIFIHQNGQQLGPLEDGAVLAGIRDGTYAPELLAWRDGMPGWQPLGTLYPHEYPTAALPPPLPVTPQLGDDLGMRLILPVGRSGWAIAAGYLGLFALVILPAPLALIVSVIAIWDIRRSKAWPHPRHGMGRAIFGLVAGGLGTGVLVMILLSRNR